MNSPTPTQLLIEIKTATRLGEIAIAERLGISQPTVNRILNGKSDCKGSTLLAILQWHSELKLQSESAGAAP